MIKRSTYIVIMVFVAILFVWIQMLMLNLIWSNDWVVNAESDNKNDFSEAWSIEKNDAEMPLATPITDEKAEYIVIAPEANDIYKNVTRTLKLMKISYISCSSVDLLPETVDENLIGLVICTGNLESLGSMSKLLSYISTGVEAYFMDLLDIYSPTFQNYYPIFGIDEVIKRETHKDIDFLENILANGTVFKVEIEPTINNVKLNGTCRKFAVAAEPDELDIKYENRIPVIWRTFYENGPIFVINMDIMGDFAYAGVFSGLLALNKKTFIYPIINSTIVLVDALPFYSTENNENVHTAYARDIVQFQRDVLWSDLTSMMKRLFIKYTYYPYIGTEQESVEQKLLTYYSKDVTLNESEWGYYPSKYFSQTLENYKPRTEMHYPSPDSTSQISFNIRDFGFVSDKTVSLPVISSGSQLDKGDVFKAFSMASAFGYVCHYIDMKEILLNPTGDDLWTGYKLDLVNSIYPFIKTYEVFDTETASDAAVKMNLYLNCKPEYEIYEDKVVIKNNIDSKMSYMVKLSDDVVTIQNCTLKQLRNDMFMVTVNPNSDAVIYLTDHDHRSSELKKVFDADTILY